MEDDLEIWRYQDYIEHPVMAQSDAKEYGALRKWATPVLRDRTRPAGGWQLTPPLGPGVPPNHGSDAPDCPRFGAACCNQAVARYRRCRRAGTRPCGLRHLPWVRKVSREAPRTRLRSRWRGETTPNLQRTLIAHPQSSGPVRVRRALRKGPAHTSQLIQVGPAVSAWF